MPAEAMSQRIDAACQSALDDKRIVGAVIMVMREGELAHARGYGYADRESAAPMQTDSLFRLASLTKPIVTAAAMRLIELGKLSLDAAVTDWLPDFKPALPDGSTPTITIRHLLTHTSGLAYDFMQPPGGPYQEHGVSSGAGEPGLTMDEELRRATAAGLSFPPGSAWLYSIAIDVLGAVLAKADGGTLGDVVARHVTGPLNMTDTSFSVVDPDRLVVPYANASPEPIRVPEDHKQPFVPGLAPIAFSLKRAFDEIAFQSGGGGMNGVAGDMVRFLDTIRAGGGDILSAESTTAMMSNQVGDLRILFDPSGSTAFGFGGAVVLDPASAGSALSPGAWQWGGVWGHSWFVDPARETTIAILTNTMLEGMAGQLPGDITRAVCAD